MPKVIKYQRRTADGLMDAIHGSSYMINEIWLPDHKILANIIGSYGGTKEEDSYVANAFFADGPLLEAGWIFGPPNEDQEKVPTIEIEIPQDLYDAIVQMAEITKRLNDLKRSVGSKMVESLRAASCFDPLARCEDCQMQPGGHREGCSFCLCGSKKDGPHAGWCYTNTQIRERERENEREKPRYHKIHRKSRIP